MLQKIEAEEENLKKPKSSTHEKTAFSKERNLGDSAPRRGEPATWSAPDGQQPCLRDPDGCSAL